MSFCCLQYDPESSPGNSLSHGHPQVVLSYLKYQWSLGDDLKRKEAFSRLEVWLSDVFFFLKAA